MKNLYISNKATVKIPTVGGYLTFTRGGSGSGCWLGDLSLKSYHSHEAEKSYTSSKNYKIFLFHTICTVVGKK